MKIKIIADTHPDDIYSYGDTYEVEVPCVPCVGDYYNIGGGEYIVVRRSFTTTEKVQQSGNMHRTQITVYLEPVTT